MSTVNDRKIATDYMDMVGRLLDRPGKDVVHIHHNYTRSNKSGWQATTYWCSHGGTPLVERACCPPRRRKKDAEADARALGLEIV